MEEKSVLIPDFEADLSFGEAEMAFGEADFDLGDMGMAFDDGSRYILQKAKKISQKCVTYSNAVAMAKQIDVRGGGAMRCNHQRGVYLRRPD